MWFLRILLPILFLFLYVSNLDAGKIYIWTDKNGVKHFSDVPSSDESLSELEIPEIDDTPRRDINNAKPIDKKPYKPIKEIETIKEAESKRHLDIIKKSAEYYFKKAEKLIKNGGYGPRKQADVLRSIGEAYLHCPCSNINEAQKYYKKAEIKASEVNKCTSINRGKTWYNTTCVNRRIKEAKIFKKIGDSYMGCSGQYIKRMEIEEMEEKIKKLERDMKFKADW